MELDRDHKQWKHLLYICECIVSSAATCGLVSNDRYVSNCCLQIRCSDCVQMVGSSGLCYFRTIHVTDVLLLEASTSGKK